MIQFLALCSDVKFQATSNPTTKKADPLTQIAKTPNSPLYNHESPQTNSPRSYPFRIFENQERYQNRWK